MTVLVAGPPGRPNPGTLVLREGGDGAAEQELKAGDPLDGGERASHGATVSTANHIKTTVVSGSSDAVLSVLCRL